MNEPAITTEQIVEAGLLACNEQLIVECERIGMKINPKWTIQNEVTFSMTGLKHSLNITPCVRAAIIEAISYRMPVIDLVPRKTEPSAPPSLWRHACLGVTCGITLGVAATIVLGFAHLVGLN